MMTGGRRAAGGDGVSIVRVQIPSLGCLFEVEPTVPHE